MRKLVFYSDQVIPENRKVDLALLDLIGKESPKIAYIPAKTTPKFSRKYFNEKVAYYKQYGIINLVYFDLGQEYDKKKIEELLACDAIHLSGGNTYYFLHFIKRRNFIPILKNFVKKGGVLVGVSAGGIIITPNIRTTTLYSEDKDDENVVGLRDFTSLGLVDFEFFPHLNQKARYLKELKTHSETSSSIIYACNDGDGIVIEDDKMRFVGEILKVKDGVISKAR